MLSRPPDCLAASIKSFTAWSRGTGGTCETRNPFGRELIGETVTAQQESIAGWRVDGHDVDINGVLDTDTPRELMSPRMIKSLFWCESAHANPLLGDAMVLGELAKGSVAQLVYPRITYVKQGRRHNAHLVASQVHRDDGRAHPEPVWIVTRFAKHCCIG